MKRTFLHADIPTIVQKLSTQEKISLLAGPNWWSTHGIERLEIPSIRMSDGPNGVRGESHFKSTPSQCLPCATSLASTFDKKLVTSVGEYLAAEARVKNKSLLLAPTCNIQRSPLGGRSFESFSEDPLLSGTLTSAYISGLQHKGVGATIKHFVANEQEHDRTSQDSVISERALREIYLYPFMMAQRDVKPIAFMTSYNRLNGTHCSENSRLLQGVLRNEWEFDGLVISDWHGTYSTDLAIRAGLDLEMPGPSRYRTPNLINHMLGSKKISIDDLSDRATNILKTVQKLARLSPDVVYSDGSEGTHTPTEDEKAFLRKVAANGIVLLRNENNLLPLTSNSEKSSQNVAVIGPNAKNKVISGGGSAALRASYVVTPWEGLTAAVPDKIQLSYAEGCYAHKYLPTLEEHFTAPNGEAGWLCEFFAHDKDGNPTIVLDKIVLQDTRVKLNDFLPKGLTEEWTLHCTGFFHPHYSGQFEFGLTVAGRAKLFLDGKLVIDNWTKQRRGEWFYGQGTVEEKAVVTVTDGVKIPVLVVYTNTPAPDLELDRSQPALMKGVRLGGCPKLDEKTMRNKAVQLAKESDVAIVVVGLNSDWESEGVDRPTLALPGPQDKLIEAIAEANPNTVVVIQAGSATSMPWVNKVDSILQTWYLGNEVGNAIADVIYGNVNPGGKLPITFPKREEDIAAYLNWGGENGVVNYREDIFVGYKHFDAHKIEPLFHFGWGLSYTTFELSNFQVEDWADHGEDFKPTVAVTVKNTGTKEGSEVVQVYIQLPKNSSVHHVEKQLRAFEKVSNLKPGESATARMSLDKYSLAYWHEPSARWRAEAGTYRVLCGTSSNHLTQHAELKLGKTFQWSKL